MKKHLILLYVLVCNFLAISQTGDTHILKNVNNIYVQTQVCEELNEYITEFEIKELIESELMNAKIKITDDKNTKFKLVTNISCRPVKGDIAFNLNFQVCEKIYLKRINENLYLDIYEAGGLGLLPNSYEAKNHCLQYIKSTTTSFIHEWKKDNQK